MDKEPLLDRAFYYDLLHITATLFIIILFASAIIAVIRIILEHRIKNKLVDKGAPDSIVAQLLQPHVKESRHVTIKWICILGAIGAGLALIDIFLPLGIHSLAIMSFSLAAGFLAYHLLTKNTPTA